MNDEDPIPRDLIALVILHALMAGEIPKYKFPDDIAGYVDLAYRFADAMIKRGDQ